MLSRTTLTLLVAGTVLTAGCVSDDYSRRDGVTSGAGDAIAANSVLQMVDPWPAGAQDTRLRVPAQRREQNLRQPGASATGDHGG